MVPVQTPRSSRGPGFDHVDRGDDQVDAEVVRRHGQRLLDNLQCMGVRHDDGARADEPGFLKQRDFQV
jgi:hypothetical protein